MNARERIAKLEGLLTRVKMRAEAPRAQAAPPAPTTLQTVPPTAEARALEKGMRHKTGDASPPAVVSLKSRTQVVTPAQQASPIVELDDADLLQSPSQLPPPVEIVRQQEKPPPSSKRPIPMEAIAEAQKDEPPPPPPPESGKLVAAAPAEVPAFDDDFTGIREASNLLPPLEANEAPIEVLHVEAPKPPPAHAMEAELSPPAAQPRRRISDVAPTAPQPAQPIEPERTAANVRAANVVATRGEVHAFKPKTFGDLLDATLAL